MQPVQAALSSWHWKLEPASDEMKVKVGLVEALVFDGPLVIVVSGGVVLTVKAGRVTKCVASALSFRLHWP